MDLQSEIVQINLDDIIPNRFQPRLNFDEKALNDLAASIKEHGIIQPLVLRKVADKYEIIAGERRYKAAGIAGLRSVPAIVSNIDDNTSAEIAIVENVQRKDLTAIEEALSYKKLLDRGYLTQEQLATKMGVSQSSIANKLRLLNLDEVVQESLLNEQISERHARSLLSLTDKEMQKTMLNRIINERMTVRQLDNEIKKLIGPATMTEEEEIPIVKITPDIETIKSNAEDLNPTVEQKNIDDLLKSNQEIQGIKPQEEKKENKFFNFLEEAPANMNMQEPVQPVFEPDYQSDEKENLFELPDLNQEIQQEQNIAITEEAQPEILDFTDSVEQLDLNFSPVSENLVEETSVVDTSIEQSTPVKEENKFISPFANTDIVDPVDLIGQEKVEEEKTPGKDISQAIILMRDTVKKLEQLGFYVETEEIDFEKIYQLIIKIEK